MIATRVLVCALLFAGCALAAYDYDNLEDEAIHALDLNDLRRDDERFTPTNAPAPKNPPPKNPPPKNPPPKNPPPKNPPPKYPSKKNPPAKYPSKKTGGGGSKKKTTRAPYVRPTRKPFTPRPPTPRPPTPNPTPRPTPEPTPDPTPAMPCPDRCDFSGQNPLFPLEDQYCRTDMDPEMILFNKQDPPTSLADYVRLHPLRNRAYRKPLNALGWQTMFEFPNTCAVPEYKFSIILDMCTQRTWEQTLIDFKKHGYRCPGFRGETEVLFRDDEESAEARRGGTVDAHVARRPLPEFREFKQFAEAIGAGIEIRDAEQVKGAKVSKTPTAVCNASITTSTGEVLTIDHFGCLFLDCAPLTLEEVEALDNVQYEFKEAEEGGYDQHVFTLNKLEAGQKVTVHPEVTVTQEFQWLDVGFRTTFCAAVEGKGWCSKDYLWGDYRRNWKTSVPCKPGPSPTPAPPTPKPKGDDDDDDDDDDDSDCEEALRICRTVFEDAVKPGCPVGKDKWPLEECKIDVCKFGSSSPPECKMPQLFKRDAEQGKGKGKGKGANVCPPGQVPLSVAESRQNIAARWVSTFFARHNLHPGQVAMCLGTAGSVPLK